MAAPSSEASQDELFLDLRALEPPEPLLRIFAALDAAPGRSLRVRLNREPFPLYPMLHAGGWSHRTRPHAEGGYEILIARGGLLAPGKA